MAGRLTQLTALFICLAGAANAQIVAPAGRTLFDRAVMVRSCVRMDSFSKVPRVGQRGASIKRFRNSTFLSS